MLEVLANFSLDHTDLGLFDLCGYCRYNEREIYIAKDMSEAMTIETIIHECVHGYRALHEQKQNEKEVDKIAKATMRRLYGGT